MFLQRAARLGRTAALTRVGTVTPLVLQLRTVTQLPTASSELVSFGEAHVARGLNRLVSGVIESASGSYVQLQDGRKMLDFTCGIGVTNLGHCHPKVSKAAADQCYKLVHGQCSIAFHHPYLELISHLIPLMPHPSLDTFFFWNSGTEAVEQAVKTARATTGRNNVITFKGAYHGRTYGSMALTRSKTIYSEGSGSTMPGVFVAEYPYWHQLGLSASSSESEIVARAQDQLDLLLSQQVSPSSIAAILIEPLLGEGGYVPAPSSFLSYLRKICDQHGIVLIFDEVQSGFGRTGKMFACEWSEGVRPDIMVFAKGIANGFPLSGIVGSKQLMDLMKPGTMGGTYAGNAVSCAAAVAVAKVMKEERVLENVNARSTELFNMLEEFKENEPRGNSHIVDIRGEGLMVAVEFGEEVKGIAMKVSKKCAEKGLLLLSTSVFDVVRFIPSLLITQDELEQGVEIFKSAVREVLLEQ